MVLDVLLETLLDSLKMLPFLYAAYLLIEWIERRQGSRIEGALAGGGRWGALTGALLGCVPQCGFSAMAANLYAGRVITLGTLLAVFLATSDEALPMLLASPSHWGTLGMLVVVKAVFAAAVGFLFDFALKKTIPAQLRGGYTGSAAGVSCRADHEENSNLFLDAARHTLEIFAFILLFSFAVGLCVELVGEARFGALLSGLGAAGPLAGAAVGLVPNCAASVLLTGLYMDGAIPFSTAVAGLCSGAGVGLGMLWRQNKSLGQNLFITGLLWALGAAAGLLVQAFGL